MSYDEHLISMAGGDGDPSTSRKLTEHQAICIWEDNVGDSGKAPTNLDLLTFANAARDDLLALVRTQQATLAAVLNLANTSGRCGWRISADELRKVLRGES